MMVFKNPEVFILDQEGKIHRVEDWKKVEDPTVVQSVVIRNEFGQYFELAKKEHDGDLKFDDALAWAEDEGGTTGTRKQWIDVYEAIHTAGLNDALRLIGGDPIRRDWYWTCEKDSDQSNAYTAWIFYGNIGYLYCSTYRILASAARVFRAFHISNLNTLNLKDSSEQKLEPVEQEGPRIGGIPAADLKSAAEKILAAADNIVARYKAGEDVDFEDIMLLRITKAVSNASRQVMMAGMKFMLKPSNGDRDEKGDPERADSVDR